VYSVQGDGYCTPTMFPQLQNQWRAHFVAALSCSGLRELALSLSSLDFIVVLPHLFPVLPDPGSGNAPLPADPGAVQAAGRQVVGNLLLRLGQAFPPRGVIDSR
jgi:hypothetical protein